jgi:thioredoxin-related protein
MKLPIVELTDLKSEKHILSSLIRKNKLNLILFYNTNCLGCTGRAIPLAYKFHKAHPFLALTVIHSSFRKEYFSKEEVLSVFTDQESPIEIYRENNHELYDFFNCEGTPHWVLMNDKQQILYSFFGSQESTQMKLQYAIEEFAAEFS